MRSRALLAGLLTLSLLIPAGITVQAADGGGLTAVVQGLDTSAYPKVVLTVILPAELVQGGAKVEKVEVRENGSTLSDVAFDAEVSRTEAVDVILVMDTSGSMKGAPLDNAKKAARAFVGKLRGDSRVAIVGFSSRPRLAVGYTEDRSRLLSVVDGLEAGGETALNDAVVTALGLVQRSQQGRANIVLLSDGGDTTSINSLDNVAKRLKEARTPIYAIALESDEANVQALRVLAGQSGGRLLAVKDASTLAGLYEGIANELQSRYSVTFTGREPNTKDLDFDVVVVAGGREARGSTVAENPQFADVELLAGTGLSEVRPANPLYLFWAVALAFGAVVLLVVGGVLLIVRPGTALEHLAYYEQLRRRADALPTGEDADDTSVKARMVGAVEYLAGKRGITPYVARRLIQADLPLRPAEYIAAHLLLVVGVGTLLQLVSGSVILSLGSVLLATILPMMWVQFRVDRRRARFEEQLPELLSLVAGSLRAGWGMQQAIDLVVEEMPPPVSTEFKRVQVETRLGLDLEESLRALAERIESDDFRSVVTAVAIQREVGGNLAEVLDIVANTIRERESLRRHVRGLTAEGRMSAVVLVILPFALFLMITLVNPNYMGQLVAHWFGFALVVFGLVLLAMGVWWLLRVSRIEA